MRVIMFALTGYITYQLSMMLKKKDFNRLIDSNIVEILYLLMCGIIALWSQGSARITLFMLLMLAVFEIVKYTARELDREKNQIVLYQIFSYINNQMRAGVRMEDVLSNVHQVITDRKVKGIIRKHCRVYRQQYNIDTFLEKLSEEFTTEDFSSVEYAIRNSVKIGFNENVMTFQEEMMFNRYIGIIKKRGERGKLKLFFAGLLLSLVLFLQIGYPLFVDFMDSLKNLY